MEHHHCTPVDTISATEFFRSQTDATQNESTRRSYDLFVKSFETYIGTRNVALAELTPEISFGFRDWLVGRGRSVQYTARLGQTFKALYRKAVKQGVVDNRPDLFEWVSSIKPTERKAKPVHGIIAILKKIADADLTARPTLDTTRNILLLRILLGGVPYNELVNLTPDSLVGDTLTLGSGITKFVTPLAADIIRRLPAGETTLLAQLPEEKSLAENVGRLLIQIGESIPVETIDDASLIFAEAIRELKTAPEVIARLISGIAPDARMRRAVMHLSDTIHPLRPRWYAMKLRQRSTTPDDIRQRLLSIPGAPAMPQIFYPCEEIARRVGNRLRHSTRAYISGVLFFRAVPSDVRPLFRAIGDMAWCYRTASSSHTSTGEEATYAVIPDASMRAFQMCIRQLPVDADIAPLDADLGIGRNVRITGGIMEGYRGTIFAVSSDPESTSRIFRLDLTADCGLKITVDIPSEYLQFE